MNIRQLEIDLDNAWWGHGDIKYEDKVATIKAMGYKVYRNSEGIHKVVKQNTTYDPSDIFDAFGGIFGNIFSGKD